MPDLLELIAENDASVLNGWAAALKEHSPQLDSLPVGQRRRELLMLAREFARRAAWAAETAEGWLTELKTRLREGMGGNKLRELLRSGRTLCGMCRTVVEIAGDLWRLSGAEGGDAISVIGQRLAAVEAEIARISRIAERPPPEMIQELFEKAKENMARGNWLTPEQARAAFRKSE